MSFSYIGGELEVFREAVNWKQYIVKQVGRHLRGDVLEVGAGIGGTTEVLCNGTQARWVCLEPDPSLAESLEARRASLPACCSLFVGTTGDLEARDLYDAILYMDTLEHVKDDADELVRAAAHLREGGHIVVVSPAHNWLYTPFDAAIGHFRRYSKASLRAVAPPGLLEERMDYLDAVGLLASAGNRVFLKSASPTLKQVHFWDRVLVRASRFVDPVLGYQLGKSVVGVWRRRSSPG